VATPPPTRIALVLAPSAGHNPANRPCVGQNTKLDFSLKATDISQGDGIELQTLALS
jgi:hypothetical protein